MRSKLFLRQKFNSILIFYTGVVSQNRQNQIFSSIRGIENLD